MLAKVLQIINVYQTLTLILILFTPSRAFAEEVAPGVEEGIIVCIDDRRTLSNIVWSCLATVFACTWLAVHPNVPGRIITNRTIPFAIERMKIMVIAILAPEVIVAWAAEQFIVAWKVCHGGYFPLSGIRLQIYMGDLQESICPSYRCSADGGGTRKLLRHVGRERI